MFVHIKWKIDWPKSLVSTRETYVIRFIRYANRNYLIYSGWENWDSSHLVQLNCIPFEICTLENFSEGGPTFDSLAQNYKKLNPFLFDQNLVQSLVFVDGRSTLWRLPPQPLIEEGSRLARSWSQTAGCPWCSIGRPEEAKLWRSVAMLKQRLK